MLNGDCFLEKASIKLCAKKIPVNIIQSIINMKEIELKIILKK